MKTRAAAALVLLTACKANPEGPPRAASSVDTTQTRSVSTTLMFRHEVLGLAVRDAVKRGDLPGAQRNARDLAARATLDASPELSEGTQAMRSAATAVANAQDLHAAATATGELVRTCATCHARLTGPVRLEVGIPPRPEPDLRVRMLRHAWAMDELWNGMIGNTEPPWKAGATVLADPALAQSELVPKKTSSPQVDALAQSVERLGHRAVAASDTSVRAAIYGELLATCADCHTRR